MALNPELRKLEGRELLIDRIKKINVFNESIPPSVNDEVEDGYEILRFLSAVNQVKLAIINEPHSNNVKLMLAEMDKTSNKLNRILTTVPKSPIALRWLYFTFPFLRTSLHFLAGDKQYDSSFDVEKINESSDHNIEFTEQDKATIHIIWAIHLFNNKHFGSACTAANQAIQGVFGQPTPDYLALAHFVLARIELEKEGGSLVKAAEHLGAMANVEGAPLERVVALHELNLLGCAADV